MMRNSEEVQQNQGDEEDTGMMGRGMMRPYYLCFNRTTDASSMFADADLAV